MPKKSSSPTKKLGEPKTPPFDGVCGIAHQLRFDVGIPNTGHDQVGVETRLPKRLADHFRLVHLFRLAPHMPVYRVDVAVEEPGPLRHDRAAHDLQRIDRKVRVPSIVRDLVFHHKALGLELLVGAFVLDPLERHRRRDIIGEFEHSAQEHRNIFEGNTGSLLDRRNHQMAEVGVGLPKSKENSTLGALMTY